MSSSPILANNNQQYLHIKTDVGFIEVIAKNNAITHLYFVDEITQPTSEPLCEQLIKARQQLEEYIHGQRQHFTLTLAPLGSMFQQHVWQQLIQIPYGETTHYQAIAEKLNKPKGSRAVGMANGKNPISIIIPCHRVIGKNGNLTGYAWGVTRKQWLLALEAQYK